MATYQLTADELLLIYLTFLARDEEGHPEYFTQWFNKIKTEDFVFEELKEIRDKLPKEILDVERKSGSLTAEARDNALCIFDVDK